MSPASFLAVVSASSSSSSGVGDGCHPINEILGRYLEKAGTSMPEWKPTGCLLTDIGNFLLQTSSLMTELADGLVSGEHISDNAERIMQSMDDDNDFSELETLDYLNQKHALLRSMNEQVRSNAMVLRTVWSDAQSPPEIVTQSGQVDAPENVPRPSLEQDHFSVSSSRRRSSTATQIPRSDTYFSSMEPEDVVSSPGLSEVKQKLPGIGTVDLSLLNIRGKGNYTCPYGFSCKKGGVQGDELVHFARNCAFKAHLQKHAKSFKCDLPGCPNKKGFARIDQLKRHQQTVRHESYS